MSSNILQDPEASLFVEAILADRANDQLRLVFADWLDEQGHPLGELLRAQCTLDETSDVYWETYGNLLETHAAEFVAPFADLGLEPYYSRGFVEIVEIAASEFARIADELFAIAPMLHKLCISGLEHGVIELSQCPALARIDELSFPYGENVGDQAVATLLNSRYLSGLRDLSLSGSSIGRTTLGALRGSNYSNVASLCLAQCGLNSAGLEVICSSEALPALKVLRLGGNGIGCLGLGYLTRSCFLPKLVELNLDECSIKCPGIEALTSTLNESSLLRLSLLGNPIGNDGVRSLASWPGLRGLVSLDLTDTNLRDDGVGELTRCVSAQTIEELRIGHNDIRDDGLEVFARHGDFPSLRRLDLAHANIRSRGLLALKDSSGFPALESVDICGNGPGRSEYESLRERFANVFWDNP